MTLDAALVALAGRLVRSKRVERNERLVAQLRENQHAAQGQGTLGAGFYMVKQKNLCIADLRDRATEIRGSYERVIVDADVTWSLELRDQIVARIGAELGANVTYLEEHAKNVIVPHGHGFSPFLADEVREILANTTAELDMFGLRRARARSRLSILLRLPRCDGPAAHWSAALNLRKSEKPEYLAAAREAINAVEGLARLSTDSISDTLGDCIKTLLKRNVLHPGTLKQLSGLWSVGNAIQGLRHGAAVPPEISEAELAYVVDAAEAVGILLVRVDQGRS